MPISIKCQACGAGFRVPEEMAGRKGKCPKCGNVLVVPAADKPKPPPVPAAPPAAVSSHAVEADNPLGIQFAPPAESSSAVMGKPKKKPAAAATKAVTPAAEKPAASEASSTTLERHRRRGGPPAWIWFLMAGLGLAVVVGGILFSIKQLSPSSAATTPTAQQQPAGAPTADAAPMEATAVAAGPEPAEIQKLIERAVVRIELQADGDQDAAAEKITGSGFLIHKSGLVVTTYHLMCQAMKADALFANGERLPVAGYVALRPDYDLAILKLQGAPVDAQALTLNSESPRPEAVVYCIGHRSDRELAVTRGTITALMPTADLPESTRSFLNEAMLDKGTMQWITYRAAAGGTASGGPLVNAKGEVVGINLFVDEKSESGLAVEASHLDAMRHRSLALAPLAKYRRRMQPVRQAEIPSESALSSSIQQAGELIAELAAKDWQPEDEADYDLFRQLAIALGQAQEAKKAGPAADRMADELQQLQKQTDETAEALKEVRWKLETSIPAVNKLAASSLAKKGSGVFFFGAYKYAATDAEKQKGMILRVEGSTQEVFVPYKLPPDLPEETFFLILGTAQGKVLLGDNPLLADERPRIVATIVFEIAPL